LWVRTAFRVIVIRSCCCLRVCAGGCRRITSPGLCLTPSRKSIWAPSTASADHATIARFRGRHELALAATFTQVLALCARAGLVSVGVVALDGSLLAGNASPGAPRSYASIRAEVERMLAEAAEADADEDARLGEARGDEPPAELVDARSRRERLRRCEEQLERAQADEQAAYEANLAWRAAWEAAHGRRLAGRKPQNPPQPDDARARPRRPPPSAPTAHGRRTGNRKPAPRGFVQQPLCGAFGPIRL
jgi:hypothetical protein